MNLVVIPPGAAAEPHSHVGYESAVYILEGRVETRYGPGLGQSVITEAGDFLFIPPKVPHQPINLSKTQAAHAIVVRNDPGEQEHAIAEGRSQISLLPAPALRAQLERTRIFLDTHGDGLDAALLRLKNAGYLDDAADLGSEAPWSVRATRSPASPKTSRQTKPSMVEPPAWSLHGLL